MSGNFAVVLLLASVCSYSFGDLPLLSTVLPLKVVPNVGQILSSSTSPNGSIITVITQLGYTVQYNLANGLVSFGQGQNRIGSVALPFEFFCNTTAIPQFPVGACYICNYDCITVHKQFGGKCGLDDAGNTTCLCAPTEEDAAARGISSDSAATCGGVNPFIADAVGQAFVELRMRALLCTKDASQPNGYNSLGCDADCVRNHGNATGVCTTFTKDGQISDSSEENSDVDLYCICSSP